MDSYTAVENLGHPGSRPTEEASYRFLCCLCSQSIPLYGLTSFSVWVSLSLIIFHFYCVTGGPSLAAVGSLATPNTDGVKENESSKYGHSLETAGHPIMLWCAYKAHTHLQICHSRLPSPEGAHKATWLARCCCGRLLCTNKLPVNVNVCVCVCALEHILL